MGKPTNVTESIFHNDGSLRAQEAKKAYARDCQTNFMAVHRAVRAWFIAYGIGVPALLVSAEGAMDKLAASPWCMWPALALFFLAVFIQIWGEMRHKEHLRHEHESAVFEAFGVYEGTDLSSDKEATERLRAKIKRYTDRSRKRTLFWGRFKADTVTVGLFGVATFLVLIALAMPGEPEPKSTDETPAITAPATVAPPTTTPATTSPAGDD